jgi:hypothetical protein
VNKNLITLLHCFIAMPATAQNLRSSVADAYICTETYSSSHAIVSLAGGNQAALAGIKNFSAIVYGERRFMLEDIGLYHAAFVLPTTSGNFGINGSYFGGSYYKETSLGLAYAKQLGKIDAGARFNYYQNKAAGYESSAMINIEVGFIFHLTEQLHTGGHIYNPVGFKKDKQAEKLPLTFSAGLGYDASEKFYFGFAVDKTEDKPINLNAGFNYSFDKKLLVRAGISSGTTSFYFGTGFLLNNLRLDITASLHPQLGITPGLMLLYNTPTKP